MDSTTLTKSVLIERDSLNKCRFPKSEVIDNAEDQKARSKKIHKATNLGNLEHKKVNIYFNDSEGLKHVYTTIWAQTKDVIILKNNVLIPVKRIVDITL